MERFRIFYSFVSFNPRTRVGCDMYMAATLDKEGRVSIHAPAWGATFGGGGYDAPEIVSIHAPAWGATGSVPSAVCNTSEFQSTHPRGVRLAVGDSGHGWSPVSIHAPAWGATIPFAVFTSSIISVSIHAPAWGATVPPPSGSSAWKNRFQSTHPRGVRPEPLRILPADGMCFNPRTRVGCD